MRELLKDALAFALRYHAELPDRRVVPSRKAVEALAQLDRPLSESGTASREVLAELDALAGPATVATVGGRYFGFVIGGALPVTVAASWLAAAWDQNAAFEVLSPAGVALERVASRWILELFGLPAGSAVGLVTGTTAANFTALLAARHALLERQGWNVEAQGLFGAPVLRVVVGEEVHASMLRAVALAGLGRERVERVAVDGQGRIRPDSLPKLDDRTIVCIQAGNVNTGAFDPAVPICEAARLAGAWVHVDGAFGLWAAASPLRAHLVRGLDQADSWAADAHKYLNVPYDCGIVACRMPRHLRAALAGGAAYLVRQSAAEPSDHTPEYSRRARGVEVWAALRSLGRSGVAALVERTCGHATRFANGLRDAGYEVLNEVVLNQVLVAFGAPEATREVVRRVQEDGTCWAGGSTWQGRTAMRISVSCWATTEDDVDRSLEAILRIARDVTGRPTRA